LASTFETPWVSIGGVITDSYAFHAFGEELGASGSTGNALRWVGQFGYYCDSARLSQVRQRALDLTRAVWLSRDPVGSAGGINSNRFTYVLNNPMRWADPSGLIPEELLIAACEYLFAAIGSFIGGRIGFAIGIGAGGVVGCIGGTLATGPGGVLTCVGGIPTGAVIGAVVGTILGGEIGLILNKERCEDLVRRRRPVPRCRPRRRRPENRDCDEHAEACRLTSMADMRVPGSVWGGGRCEWCLERCKADGGVWPYWVPTTDGRASCQYWLRPSV
jgi:RHS repeat-associated protein